MDRLLCAICHHLSKEQSLVIKLVTTLFNIINITTYFENLIIELHVLYALNKHVKSCANQILFTM